MVGAPPRDGSPWQLKQPCSTAKAALALAIGITIGGPISGGHFNPAVSLGVLLFHEAMSPARWGGFVIIWIALIIIAADGVRAVRRVDAVTEPA